MIVKLLEKETLTNEVSYHVSMKDLDDTTRFQIEELLKIESPSQSELNQLALLLNENSADIDTKCVDSNNLDIVKIIK